MSNTTTSKAPLSGRQRITNAALYPLLLAVGGSILLVIFNLIAKFSSGHLTPLAPGVGSSPYDIFTGIYPAPMPWWFLALCGLALLFCAVFGAPVAERTKNDFRSAPATSGFGALARYGLMASWMIYVIDLTYDGLVSPWSPYWIPPIIFVVAGVVFLFRWKFSPVDAATIAEDPTPVITPSVLGRIAGAAFAGSLAAIVLGVLSVPANLFYYLATHDGALPPHGHQPWLTGEIVFHKHMAIDPTTPLFLVAGGLFVFALLASWSWKNRLISTEAKRRVFFRTSTSNFWQMGWVLSVIAGSTGLWYHYSGDSRTYSYGIGLFVLGALLAALRGWKGPKPPTTAKRRRKKASQPQEAVR